METNTGIKPPLLRNFSQSLTTQADWRQEKKLISFLVVCTRNEINFCRYKMECRQEQIKFGVLKIQKGSTEYSKHIRFMGGEKQRHEDRKIMLHSQYQT